MVLPTVMMLTAISTRSRSAPDLGDGLLDLHKGLVISMGAVTLYTPGMLSNVLLMLSIWLRSARETGSWP